MDKSLALIIEDEYDISIIFARALQAAGFETEIIRAGDTALTWLSCTTPALVILDLHLPRVPGEDILHYIRAEERLANTKVIIATAYASMAERLRDKVDWTLMKPVSFSQLRDLAARFGTGTSPNKQHSTANQPRDS